MSTQIPREVERKFLVVSAPADPEAVQLTQGYLALGDKATGAPEVRVRLTRRAHGAEEAEITTKGEVVSCGTDPDRPRERTEVTAPCSLATGAQKLALAPYVLTKTRHAFGDLDERIGLGGWDVDVYDGRLVGLVVAEVEWKPEVGSAPPPPNGLVLGPEITHDKRFSNAALAQLDAAAAAALVAEAQRLTARSIQGEGRSRR